MKALVYTGPHAMEVRDVADPTPAASDELLIRVEACGICGSDMHAWHGHDDRRPAPLVLGHEAVGTIVEGDRAGTRVAVNPLVTCQTCEHCLSGRENLCFTRQIISMPPREGAFSQFIAVPERNLVAVPDHVKPVAASLTEPLACGWHAVRLADQAMFKPMAEARVLVLGGGAIGLGAALAEALVPDYHVLAVGRTTGALEDIDDLIQAKGGSATLAPMDICETPAMAQLCRSIYDRWGKVDLWCHTAIHAAPLAPVNHIDVKDFSRSMKVNVEATSQLISFVAPLLGTEGQAVFFDDTGASGKFFGSYGASKAAIMYLAEGMYADLKDTGIDVQVINPGFIKTRLTDKNDFQMPFIMEPDEAAEVFFNHMKLGGFKRSFPRLFSWLFRGSQFLPDWAYYRIFSSGG